MRKAFTLIELLIATTIFALVSIAIYAVFNSGMVILRRAKEVGTVEQRVLLKAEKISRELRQAREFKDIGFFGNKEKIQFPAVIDSRIVRLTYFFDKERGSILSVQDKFSPDILEQLEEEKGKEKPEDGHALFSKPVIFLENVEKLEFSFGYIDAKNNLYSWKDTWQQDNLPLAVKLSVTSKDKSYATVIFIPTVS